MTERSAPGGDPRQVTTKFTSDDPDQRCTDVNDAIHNFITTYRDPPHYIVVHPDDYRPLAACLEAASTSGSGHPVDPRLDATREPGGFLLTDVSESGWQAVSGAPQ